MSFVIDLYDEAIRPGEIICLISQFAQIFISSKLKFLQNKKTPVTKRFSGNERA